MDIESILRGFEDRSLPKEKWTHEAHLLVGLWHLKNYSLEESILLMRIKIIGYNNAVGTPNTLDSGYHETLTQFWLYTIQAFLEDFGTKKGLEESYYALLKSPFADRNRALLFYKKEELMAIKARATFISL